MSEHKKYILLLDDDDAHRMIARRALQKGFQNVEILEAPSLAAAREVLSSAREELALAIVDINLRNETGLDIIPELKTRQSSLPILVISTSGLDVDIEAAKDRGASAYVIKAPDPVRYRTDLAKAAKPFLE